MTDTSEKEVTDRILIITLGILIALCSLLFKCTYGNNQYALNYHKAVEICKSDIVCIKCYVVATDARASIKDCVGEK
jgi:hypothetical protein